MAVLFSAFPRIAIAAADRLSLAILAPETASDNSESKDWNGFGLDVVKLKIGLVRSVRVLPRSSIDYAIRELKLGAVKTIDAAQANQIGEAIEANWVLWWTCRRTNEEWNIKVTALKVAGNMAPLVTNISSGDWRDIQMRVSLFAIKSTGISPNGVEMAEIEQPITKSTSALTCMVKAWGNFDRRESVDQMQANLRQAISDDPHCALALRVLTYMLISVNKLDEAVKTGRQAVHESPELAKAHLALGEAYLAKGLSSDARSEFKTAINDEPGEAACYDALARTYIVENNREQSLAFLKQAVVLAPYDAQFRATLALDYVALKQPENAISELALAERYCDKKDVTALLRLATGYDSINDSVKAVKYYEMLLAGVRSMNVNSPIIETANRRLKELKGVFTPHFIEVSEPSTFTASDLEKQLRSVLSPTECVLAIDPLQTTEAMRRKARELAGDATDEQEKAKRLFEYFRRPVNQWDRGSRRTASEAFNDWADLDNNFTCQEYTLLYLALARNVGLRAYYVLVNKDYESNVVSHACAGVFIGTNAVLVDPIYNWFGVPHKDYRFLNDLQVRGVYMAQMDDVVQQQIAVKIIPDFAMAHFLLGMTLASQKSIAEARKELDLGLQIDSNSWSAFLAKGIVEWYEGGLDAAESDLQRSIDLYPSYSSTHFYLGGVLFQHGKIRAAKEEYQTFLKYDTWSNQAEVARKTVAQINDILNDQPASKR